MAENGERHRYGGLTRIIEIGLFGARRALCRDLGDPRRRGLEPGDKLRARGDIFGGFMASRNTDHRGVIGLHGNCGNGAQGENESRKSGQEFVGHDASPRSRNQDGASTSSFRDFRDTASLTLPL